MLQDVVHLVHCAEKTTVSDRKLQMRRKRRRRGKKRVREFIHETGQYFRKVTERNLDRKIDEKKKGRREEETEVCEGGY